VSRGRPLSASSLAEQETFGAFCLTGRSGSEGVSRDGGARPATASWLTTRGRSLFGHCGLYQPTEEKAASDPAPTVDRAEVQRLVSEMRSHPVRTLADSLAKRATAVW
jgi:hypothetical protein